MHDYDAQAQAQAHTHTYTRPEYMQYFAICLYNNNNKCARKRCALPCPCPGNACALLGYTTGLFSISVRRMFWPHKNRTDDNIIYMKLFTCDNVTRRKLNNLQTCLWRTWNNNQWWRQSSARPSKCLLNVARSRRGEHCYFDRWPNRIYVDFNWRRCSWASSTAIMLVFEADRIDCSLCIFH